MSNLFIIFHLFVCTIAFHIPGKIFHAIWIICFHHKISLRASMFFFNVLLYPFFSISYYIICLYLHTCITMQLVLCGTIHQGDKTFTDASQGGQCSFMALSSLLHWHTYPVHTPTQATIHAILCHGYKMWASPDVGNFSISDLPVVAYCLDGRQVTLRYES